MDLQGAIVAFLAHRVARRCSVRTIDQYRYQLVDLWHSWRVVEHLGADVQSITAEEFTAYFYYLAHEHINKHKPSQRGLAAETCASAWRVIRTFWNFAAKRRWLAADQLDYFRDDELIARPATHERIRPALQDCVLSSLLQACSQLEERDERLRSIVIVRLLADTGARISELAGLRIEHMDMNERRAKVIGKGNREEWVFWGYRTAVALKAYLTPAATGPLLTKHGKQMTTTMIRLLIKRLAALAGASLPAGAPVHSFRHRFAHKALDSGLDSSQVGQLLRHRHHETTLRYLREDPKRLQALHRRVMDS